MTKRPWERGALLRSLAVLVAVAGACTSTPRSTGPNAERPAGSSPPVQRATPPSGPVASFAGVLDTAAVDKVDLLFVIDNSPSMGDAQKLLAAAVPDLMTRLVAPSCVDDGGRVVGVSAADGSCATGQAEFPPVRDMHIGIVTSSLGGRGGNECPATDTFDYGGTVGVLNAHEDDQAHLVNRGGDDEHAVAKALPNDFLSWFPDMAANGPSGAPPPANAETTVGAPGTPNTLVGDFTDMVAGVHDHGCVFGAPSEAWYRFLVQPDPFETIDVETGSAVETGVDSTLLAQRKAFLRPDSLLAVIVVTDENEAVANPLSVAGQGWLYEQYPWPNSPNDAAAPEGTIQCQTNPNDPKCQSCVSARVVNAPTFAAECPDDPPDGTHGYLSSADDPAKLRFWHQKQRFGVFAGYPLTRYTRGLMQLTVPDRLHEVAGDGTYVGDESQFANCVNPIYAQDLPDGTSTDATTLCHLTPGPRTPNQVFYAAIAGVPHQLLQSAPGDSVCPAGTAPQDCPQKPQLAETDWTAMTGADAESYDFTGADFHMIESNLPRPGSSCPPTSADSCDPMDGREWDTKKGDLEFACIFPLVDPNTGAPQPKDCTLPQYAGACDCQAGDLRSQTQLCAKDAQGNYTTRQIFGKAYPSVREIEIAHAMAGSPAGVQGVVSSLCPIHTTFAGGNTADPLFGYRPAVGAIVDRLKSALELPCLTRPIEVQSDGAVPCLLLVTLPENSAGEQVCTTAPGLSIPPPEVIANVQASALAVYQAAGGASSGLPNPADQPICEVTQIGRSDPSYSACVASSATGEPGWCYVTSDASGSCPQRIRFTPGVLPQGGVASLQCVETLNAAADGGSP